MRRASGRLSFGFFVSSVALACTPAAVAPEPSPDGGFDAAPAHPAPSNAPDASADAADAGRPAIVPASRLEVQCAQPPCYVAVSGTGGEHVCGLLADGTVRCWGRDTRARAEPSPDGGTPEADGALGRGRPVSALEGATPAPVVGLQDVTQISVGSNLGTCALTSDGSVYCWGRNEFGQLGRPPSEPSLPIPTRVEGLPPISKVALGATTGCAIAKADGALYCWGTQNTRIGLGLGPSTTFPPQEMTAFAPPVREIAIGSTPPLPINTRLTFPFQDTILALRDDGVLASLGELPAGGSSNGELHLPVPIEQPGVLRSGAFAYLGVDGVLTRWVPERRALYVPGASSVVDVAIAPGRSYRAGVIVFVEQAGVLLADGHLYRWGRNTAGALGYSPDELDLAAEPLDMTHVAGGRVVSFAMTTASTCVSLVDGTVKCWGSNQRGELGRGTIDYEHHPEAEVIR